jgi:hypothetical protein
MEFERLCEVTELLLSVCEDGLSKEDVESIESASVSLGGWDEATGSERIALVLDSLGCFMSDQDAEELRMHLTRCRERQVALLREKIMLSDRREIARAIGYFCLSDTCSCGQAIRCLAYALDQSLLPRLAFLYA